MALPGSNIRSGFRGTASGRISGKKAAVGRVGDGKAARGRAGKTARAGSKGKAVWKVLKVGLHFGSSRTRVAASKNGEEIRLKKTAFTNIVGFLKLSAPFMNAQKGSDVLYADDAFKFIRQVDLKKPIHLGMVVDVRVCKQLVTHIASAVDPSGTRKLWGVASIPVTAGPEEWDKARRSLSGTFQRVAVVPEPYLAAEGMHLEKCVRSRGTLVDLTKNSLVIDIGAATTDLCLVRGEFPSTADQIRIEKAGNSIDERILNNALIRYPTLCMTHRMAREIKEEQAFVGTAPTSTEGSRLPGSSDLFALIEVIRSACEDLLQSIVNASCDLLGRCDPDAATNISRNIILTGGGSRIRNLAAGIEERLRAGGYPQARILVPEDHTVLVARGAVRFGEKLSDEEWKAQTDKLPGKAEPEVWIGGGAEAPPNEPSVGLVANAQRTVSRREPPTPSAPLPPLDFDQAEARTAATTPAHLREAEAVAPGAPSRAPSRPLSSEPPPAKPKKDFAIEDLEDLELWKGL